MAVDVAWAQRWVALTQQAMSENREYLIDLDRQIGDADHGENMDRGFLTVVSALETAEVATVADILKVIAKTLMSTVGGAAGPLYGTAFLRASKAAALPELTSADVCALLAGALEGIQVRGKAVTGEKTMLDVWSPALDSARLAAEAGATAEDVLRAAADAAREGAQATVEMKATKGRASYLGERSIGHMDPGAYSSALILQAAVTALTPMEGEA